MCRSACAPAGPLRELDAYTQKVIRARRRGAVEPKEFVPLAETSGLISSLGESVLRKACIGARTWQKDGRPEFMLAVNLSPGQIKDPRLAESLAFENV